MRRTKFVLGFFALPILIVLLLYPICAYSLGKTTIRTVRVSSILCGGK